MTDPLTTLRQGHAHRVPDTCPECRALAQVETLIQAARVVNGNGVGEFDTRTTAALFPLRDALAPFTNNTP